MSMGWISVVGLGPGNPATNYICRFKESVPGWKLGGIVVQVAEIWNPLEYMSEAACATIGGFQRGRSGITCARIKIAHWVAAVLAFRNSSRNTAQVKCRYDDKTQKQDRWISVTIGFTWIPLIALVMSHMNASTQLVGYNVKNR